MTEYTDAVRRVKLKLDVEEWGKTLKYYHFNDGIRERHYNNGNIEYEDVRTGKKWKGKVAVNREDAYMNI
jgi:hypothetical protein